MTEANEIASRPQPAYPRLGQAIWLLIVLFFAQVFTGSIAAGIQFARGKDISVGDPTVLGIANAASFGLVLLWAARKARPSRRSVFSFRGFNPRLLLPIAVMMLGLNIVSSEADNILRQFMPAPAFLNELFEGLVKNTIASFVTLVVVAPVTEELFFRGILLQGFLSRYHAWKAIFLSAFLFCIFHLNPYQFFVAFMLGVVLGWLFYRTGSLWLCMIAHAFLNSLPLLISLLPIEIPGYISQGRQITSNPGLQPIWFDAIGIILLCVGIVRLARLLPPKNNDNDAELNEPLSESL